MVKHTEKRKGGSKSTSNIGGGMHVYDIVHRWISL